MKCQININHALQWPYPAMHITDFFYLVLLRSTVSVVTNTSLDYLNTSPNTAVKLSI